jgi:WD40 repeat protein
MGVRQHHALYMFGLALCGLLACGLPVRAEGRDAPILMLDSGGHMALIRNVIVAGDGAIISAGDDKVIRIWDAARGTTVRTIRGEIGDGDIGKILALALSPDGRLIAAGGRLPGRNGGEGAIRIYERSTGTLLALLEGHTEAVLSLAFSPDGSMLASGGMDDTAILWSLADAAAVRTFKGHQGDVNAVRFSPDGARLATASDDSAVGLWKVGDATLIAELNGHTDFVIALAFSPADGTLASSGLDRSIRLWDGVTGAALRSFADRPSSAMSIAFSPDGNRILAGADKAPFAQAILDATTGATLASYRGHDGLTHAVAFADDGATAVTAGGSNNEIHLWDSASGRLAQVLAGKGRSIWSVGMAPDGSAVAWGTSNARGETNNQGPLEYELRMPAPDRPLGAPKLLAGSPKRFATAVPKLGSLSLQLRLGGDWGYYALLDIVRSGKVLATIERTERDGYGHNAYGFLDRGRSVVSGAGHGWLSLYTAAGERRGDFIGHTSDVWAVAASDDGKRLVSGGDDQTVRIWNPATFENIASIFHSRTGDWVIWTPEGYYAASPDGDRYVGWQINQGAAAAARFVTAAQLKQHFYRPDIISRALFVGSARQAVGEAKLAPFDLAELNLRRPPELSIAGASAGETVTASPLRLALRVETNADGLQSYSVLVNGRQVAAETVALSGAGAQEIPIEVPLASGENVIEVTASNAVGASSASLTVTHQGAEDLERRGTLYVIAIGVDDYPNLKQNLTLAGRDAAAFAEDLIARAGPFHDRVVKTILSKSGDRRPTAAEIGRALLSLRAAGPRDTVVLFLAGHGINDGAEYLFLPTDAARKDGQWVRNTVIDWQALQDTLQSVKGRRIMLVDTCHAGNAFNGRLVKDAADASIVVLAATDGDTVAEEQTALGHGVFTYAVLEGLGGGADLDPDGKIRAQELALYVATRVPALTGGRQAPTAHVSDRADFVVVTR